MQRSIESSEDLIFFSNSALSINSFVSSFTKACNSAGVAMVWMLKKKLLGIFSICLTLGPVGTGKGDYHTILISAITDLYLISRSLSKSVDLLCNLMLLMLEGDDIIAENRTRVAEVLLLVLNPFQ